MPTVNANGIDIYYEEAGSLDDPAVLLVNGYTSQLTSWEDSLVNGLVDAGFRVIRFDNRDVGLTSKTPGRVDASSAPPYAVTDMAADGMALLQALGIDQAHVVGASMGGMIVQHMAFEHPDRVLSLTSIMSTTGNTAVGTPSADAMSALLTPPPKERDAFIDHTAKTWSIFSGPHYDEERARRRAATAYDRCFNPAGAAFQMAAIMADGDRTDRLAGVRCPTVVIHGRADTLVGLSGGEATAEAIPGAELVVLDDMGHDVVPQVVDRVIDAIVKVAARA
jgi:pimeloyl-ACP methyl ester carboxylesterase